MRNANRYEVIIPIYLSVYNRLKMITEFKLKNTNDLE